MGIELRQLRVSAEMDASRYTAAANQKVAADAAMSQSGREAGAAITQTDQKISQAGDALARFNKRFQDGYSIQQQFNNQVMAVARGVDTGRHSFEQMIPALNDAYRRHGLLADAIELERRGFSQLAAQVREYNAAVAATPRVPVNDNGPGARFRRQNLTYQAFDVAQGIGLSGGDPRMLGMVAMQQGPQILQLYAGQGGVNAALRDAGTLATGLLTRLGPVAVAAGLVAAAIETIRHQIERTSGETVSFGEVFKATMQVAADAAHQVLKPAINLVGGWLATAWDAGLRVTYDAVNNLVKGFQAGYVLIRDGIMALPDAFIVAGENAANGFMKSIIWMAQEVQTIINGMIGRINSKLGTSLPDLGPASMWKDYQPFDLGGNEAQKRLDAAAGNTRSSIAAIASSNPLGALADLILGQIKENRVANALPDGSDGNPIPIPKFRNQDSIDYYGELEKASQARIRSLQSEHDALGLTGAAAKAFRLEQEALNEAIKRGIELSPEQIGGIQKMAQAYADVAQAIENTQLQQDLLFEGQQLQRSPLDQSIASRLRGTGLGMDSPQAQFMRDMQAYSDAKELATGFLDSFKSALMSNGGDIGDALGQAILTAANNALDKQLQAIFDKLANWFASWLTGFNPMSGLGAAIPNGIPGPWGNSIGASVAAAANDNSLSNKIVRMPLAPLSSTASGGSGGGASLLSFLTSGKAASHVDGMQDLFQDRLSGLLNDPSAPDGLGIFSGYRSVAHQRQLWQAALRKYGSPEAARKWVAPPGNSFHNKGLAADLSWNGRSLKHAPESVQDWVHSNADRYGLDFPMRHEPWHIEAAGARTGAIAPYSGQLPAALDKLTASATKAGESVGGFSDALGTGVKNLTGAVGSNGTGTGSLITGLLNKFPAAPAGGGPMNFAGPWGAGIGGAPASGGGFLSALFGIFGSLFGFAEGTENAPAGWAWVGERGPELRKLRAGDVIRSNAKSREMASGGSGQPAFAPVFNIDARGSTMSAGQYRLIARQESQAALSTYRENQVRGDFDRVHQRYTAQKG